MGKHIDELVRFWSKVDKRSPSDCWEWTGGKSPLGYGVFYTYSRKRTLAHRYSLSLHLGRDLEGHALHSCDNPPCVNPQHLREGTQADNVQDMCKRGRHVPVRGTKSGNAKLTEANVVEIARLYATGEYSHRKLALIFGVHHKQVGDILRGKIWPHVMRPKIAVGHNRPSPRLIRDSVEERAE